MSAAAQTRAAAGFRVRDLPEDMPIFQSMAARLDFERACAGITPRKAVPELIELELAPGMLEGLRAAAGIAIERYGLHGWLSAEGREEEGSYLSISLTHNPDLVDPGVTDVHQATLGTSVNPMGEFFYGSVRRFRKLKNTYFDTYGFRQPTPAARIGALGEFLSQCGLSLVRSRLSVLVGARPVPVFSAGWHRDESVFENLRINIPLVSDGNYRLQLERERDTPDPASATMSDHFLAPGRAYTFDTHRPHRVYGRAACAVDRIHLVLGLAPWFSYDADDDAWVPNEFYGRKHPFDIVREGALHSMLRLHDQ